MNSESCKVAIIGAGFAGLSAAISLARKGFKNIHVFYDQNDKHAASHSAHGMSTIKGILEADDDLFSLKLEGHRGFHNWVEELEEITGMSRSDRVWLKRVVEKFKSIKDFRKDFGRIYRRDFIGAKNVRLEFSEPDCFASAIYPDDFWIDPEYLLQLLETSARMLGVCLRHGRVAKIIANGKFSTLLFEDQSRVICDVVVVAAGAGSSKLIDSIQLQKKINLLGVAGLTFEVDTHDAQRSNVKGINSLVSTQNRAFWGSTSDPARALQNLAEFMAPSSGEAEQVGSNLLRLFEPPLSVQKKIKWKWGVRVRSRNRSPVVMCIQPGSNIWINSGYYKSGIILSWLFAERVSEEIRQCSQPLNP